MPDARRLRYFEIMEEIERRVIVDMLERTGWNQTEAAERFQIPLSTLNQKIKRLGIETAPAQQLQPQDPGSDARSRKAPANRRLFAVAFAGACDALGDGLVAARHQRRRKIHTRKIHAFEIRLPQNGDAHVRAGELRALDVRAAEVGVAQVGALEVGVAQVAAEKFHAAGLRLGQVGARQHGFGHVRVAQVRAAQIGSRKIGAHQLGLLKIRALEIGVLQNRAGKIGLTQIGEAQVRAGQVGALAARLRTMEFRVRVKNVAQTLAANGECSSASASPWRPIPERRSKSPIRATSVKVVIAGGPLRTSTEASRPKQGTRRNCHRLYWKVRRKASLDARRQKCLRRDRLSVIL